MFTVLVFSDRFFYGECVCWKCGGSIVKYFLRESRGSRY